MRDERAAAELTQDRIATEAFAEQLRALRSDVGGPSFRKMAGRSGRISHTTLHEAAAGTRFPSWETTREFVRACDADEALWRTRWEDAQRREPEVAAANVDPVAEVAADIEPEHKDEPRRHRWWWLAAAAAVVLAAVVGITHPWSSPSGSSAAPAPTSSPTPSTTPFSDSLIPGDSSKFVGDVTIPDGTKVKVDAEFIKVWALANVGKVDWHNRYLARINPTADADGCQTPDRVQIGDTPPGDQVMISVPVTAPSRPGKCWVSWKMVDANGKEYFPTRRPVYFMVNVIA
ncbi:Helix-turn-helix domain-containing protein [Asanoa hainanensis]|uniref:Helix-turn-helix domain-containing protein n=1 Tax=Asanoa hainanensis TaxID=560556 RepID=A0A239MSP8_9ACTN|nr:NBR1-Ig-like domain-containing protein [Asanoa hainanensis]SNT45761.1 Helix-turn-helix domain-containing protein [Asanoa hainanensis]